MSFIPVPITMHQPTAVGAASGLLPENVPNRGSTTAVVAWSFWRQLMGTELPAALDDLQSLPYI
jgi:hypothetical protein